MRLESMAEVRKSRGLNQTALGERIGRDQSYVSKIERGMNVPNKAAEDIAHALLCNVSDLVKPEDTVVTLRLSDVPPEMLQAIAKKER